METGITEINGVVLSIRMYNGQRVVTFKDIDNVHSKEEGVTKRNFSNNKKYLIKNEDYFEINHKDVGESFTSTYGFNNKAPKGILLTEMGYLMIAKSFSDPKSWEIQRQLVNSYFTLHEVGDAIKNNTLVNIDSVNAVVESLQRNFGAVCGQVNSMESVLDYQYEMFKKVMENMTLSTRQQELILRTARKRVNYLLGEHIQKNTNEWDALI